MFTLACAVACAFALLAFVGARFRLSGSLQSLAVTHGGLSLTRPGVEPCASWARDDLMLFSTRSSPTGKWVAENRGNFCNGYGENYIAIRKSGSELSPSDKLMKLWGPDLSLFFVWTDDDHLAVKEGPFRPIMGQPVINGPAEFKGIHVAYSRYGFEPSGQDHYKAGNVARITVPADRVTAAFDEERYGQGKMCELSLSMEDGTTYDAVGLDIDINTTPCHNMICGGVSSQF